MFESAIGPEAESLSHDYLYHVQEAILDGEPEPCHIAFLRGLVERELNPVGFALSDLDRLGAAVQNEMTRATKENKVIVALRSIGWRGDAMIFKGNFKSDAKSKVDDKQASESVLDEETRIQTGEYVAWRLQALADLFEPDEPAKKKFNALIKQIKVGNGYLRNILELKELVDKKTTATRLENTTRLNGEVEKNILAEHLADPKELAALSNYVAETAPAADAEGVKFLLEPANQTYLSTADIEWLAKVAAGVRDDIKRIRHRAKEDPMEVGPPRQIRLRSRHKDLLGDPRLGTIRSTRDLEAVARYTERATGSRQPDKKKLSTRRGKSYGLVKKEYQTQREQTKARIAKGLRLKPASRPQHRQEARTLRRIQIWLGSRNISAKSLLDYARLPVDAKLTDGRWTPIDKGQKKQEADEPIKVKEIIKETELSSSWDSESDGGSTNNDSRNGPANTSPPDVAWEDVLAAQYRNQSDVSSNDKTDST